jgi:Ca-activated chloride channel homolog
MRPIPFGLFVPLLAGAVVTAQTPSQQQPTFRGGVRSVPVYATVSDDQGGFVLDLTKDDFEIRDNGKVQTITTFTTDLAPITAVVLLDGSGSMLPQFEAVKEGASSFIIRLLPEDRVRVGSFADLIRFDSEFTSDRDALLEFLHNEFNMRMANETRLWDALRESTLMLGHEPGRRVVIVFTDGYDTTSLAGAHVVMANARERDVIVYGIAMWTGRGTQQVRPSRDLEFLAADTGGGYYELSERDEMNSTFTRVAAELHQQYVMAFTPQTFDGKVHNLEVKVKRPHTKVRARKTYLAEVKSP